MIGVARCHDYIEGCTTSIADRVAGDTSSSAGDHSYIIVGPSDAS